MTTVATPRSARVATLLRLELNRPCPACGNEFRERCKRWFVIPEFEVVRCECGATFINRVINDNSGFAVDYEIKTDPALLKKIIRDFQRIKARLKAAGVVEFRDKRLLDVGCGIGTFLQQPEQEGWSVAGLELSPSAAAYAREHRSLDVRTGSIESPTSFPSGSFDIITMFGVIEHLASPRSAAQECARLLRPGGFLVLQTPTEDGLFRRIGRALYCATDGLVTFQVRELYSMGGGHSVCFNRRSIRALLSHYGFEILSIDQSTYGLRVLLMRFENLAFHKKLVYSLATSVLFALGKILRGNNHMTVYARTKVEITSN